MAGGGLALMVVPPLTDATSWRAPYWTAALLAILSPRSRLSSRRVFRASVTRAPGCSATAALLPIGILQAATFGLAVVAGNWVVPLLERQGASSTAAGLAGGLILFVGIVTRPAGGLLAGRVERTAARRDRPRRARRRALCFSRSAARSRSRRSARFVLGLTAGLPFAVIFAAAQRAAAGRTRRRDRPRERVRRAHDPRRHTARRPRVRAAERRSPRLRRDRRARARPRSFRFARHASSADNRAFRTSEGETEMALSFGVTVLPDPPYEPLPRADPARRGERLRVRLDVRLARALAGVVPAAHARGAGDLDDEVRPLRDEPGHARADGPRERLRDAARHLGRPHGDGHRTRRLGAPLHRRAARPRRRVRAALPR